MKSGVALAIFVKTPGLSPIKTRLASSIGLERSQRFYELSLRATEAVVLAVRKQVPALQAYWCVAESAGLTASVWQSLPAVFQGEGNLGDRLGFVYDQLLERHHHVCFMGTDSPHLTVPKLRSAISAAAFTDSFVLGETKDGGFYFFGGSSPLPRELWRNVQYSSEQTSAQLKAGLVNLANIKAIDPSFDIDTAEDLFSYNELSAPRSAFLQEQRELFDWVRTLK